MKNRYISILTALIIAVTSISVNSKVFAYNEFYSSNDILFYDELATGCADNSSNIKTSASSTENQKPTAQFLISTNFSGNGDKPLNAVQMAAILGNIQAESGFNPKAGEGRSFRGIVQWNSPGRWDGIKKKKGLQEQLNFIKTELDGNYYKKKLSEFWSASALTDLDKATYAITRNYEVPIMDGTDGGPTLWVDTNNADAGKNLQAWEKRRAYAHELYNKFGNLAKSGYTPSSECGGLVSGGMNLEQAKKFMNAYKNLEPKKWPLGTLGTPYKIYAADCSESPLANCVAFSQYFINRYTTKTVTGLPDGQNVVKRLLALGFTDGANTPKAYSIFSKSGGKYGHTGVVLGIDTVNDKIIIGEAGCGEGLNWIDAREKKLSNYSNNNYTYVYTDNILKDGL